jgi:hypothetical protein
MASSFTRTAVIRKSRFAAVIMPLSPYQIAIFDDLFVNKVEFPTIKTVILSERHRIDPEFTWLVFSADMDMNRFFTVETEKKNQ